MARKHIGGQFLAVAEASIAAAATATDGTEFTSREINVRNVDFIAVQLEAAGAGAAITGTVTAYFAGAPNNIAAWDTYNATTQPFASTTLAMTTNAIERHTTLIDVRGLAWIKLMAVVNGADDAIEVVNINYGRSIEIV